MLVPTLALLSTLFAQTFAFSTKDIVLAEQITTGAAAVSLAKGSYIFTNVATGQKLTYVRKSGHGKFNAIIPKSGKGSVINVTPVGSGSMTPWYTLEAGNGHCLSSAWSGNKDVAAVAYACIKSRSGKNTLEPTKQNFILTPVSKPLGTKSSKASEVLIAAQNLSVATRKAALKAAFGKRFLKFLKKRGGVDAHENMLKKRGTVSSGTFYIIPSDHLIDQVPKALASGTTTLGGSHEGRLVPWKKGDKSQQWRVTRA